MNEQKKEYIKTEIMVVKSELKSRIKKLGDLENLTPEFQKIIELQNLIFALERGERSTYKPYRSIYK